METFVQASHRFINRATLLVAVVAGLAVASPAAAQDSVRDGYGGAAGVLGEVDTVAPSSGSAPSASETPAAPAAPVSQAQPVDSGELPFTGLDIALLGAGGGLLLGLGLLVRRMTREPMGSRSIA